MGQERARLLFADDEREIQVLLRRVAEKEGYEVLQAFDGEEALRLVHEGRPDLIILDVMMPKMDGRDLCKRLKGDPKTSSIPIIMFSAKGEQWDRLVALELGADEYVDKPFSIEQLLSKVRYQLWKARGADPKDAPPGVLPKEAGAEAGRSLRAVPSPGDDEPKS